MSGQNAAQRVALQLPPRRAPQDDFKKGTISRAEGGQLQAPVGRRPEQAVNPSVIFCVVSSDEWVVVLSAAVPGVPV